MRDDFLNQISTIFVCTTFLVDMRKHNTIGIRVSARRGEFLPKEPSRERNIRGGWYGFATESVGDNLWVITWDNGQSTREKSTALCIEAQTSGRQPLLLLSPEGQAPPRASSIDDGRVPDHMAGAAGAFLISESAPRLSLSVASNDVDGTGEKPWETLIGSRKKEIPYIEGSWRTSNRRGGV